MHSREAYAALMTRSVREEPNLQQLSETAPVESGPAESAPEERNPVGEGSVGRSATRLVALFEALATLEEGISLAELSATIAAPKSSLLGLLRSMVALGYMEHGRGLYRLGPKAFRLAADILAIRRF